MPAASVSGAAPWKLPRWDMESIPGEPFGIWPGLTALAWVVHWGAHRMKAMAPTENEAYAHFHSNDGEPPAHYPPFNSFIYSLENCLPLIKFGQDDHWQADSNPLMRPASASRASVWGARLGS